MGHRAPHPFQRQGLVVSLVLATVALTGALSTAHAQGDGSSALRAANMARMTAEKLNGGLQVYRTAACMHQQAGGSCLIQASKAGYLFRFTGGRPGWQQSGKPPSVETEILVAPDGRSILDVKYNGPVRSPEDVKP
jgi:hypothetical protein